MQIFRTHNIPTEALEEILNYIKFTSLLAIEKGRHDGLQIEQRVCTFCPDRIEDEAHFLFQCPTYQVLRERYLEPVIENIRGFEFFPIDFKVKAIMSEMKYGTCKFIAEATDLREFLISKPKVLD